MWEQLRSKTRLEKLSSHRNICMLCCSRMCIIFHYVFALMSIWRWAQQRAFLLVVRRRRRHDKTQNEKWLSGTLCSLHDSPPYICTSHAKTSRRNYVVIVVDFSVEPHWHSERRLVELYNIAHFCLFWFSQLSIQVQQRQQHFHPRWIYDVQKSQKRHFHDFRASSLFFIILLAYLALLTFRMCEKHSCTCSPPMLLMLFSQEINRFRVSPWSRVESVSRREDNARALWLGCLLGPSKRQA